MRILTGEGSGSNARTSAVEPILSSAATHQAQASNSWLQGHKAPGIALRQPPLQQGLTKARALMAERKAKKIDASILEERSGPKISVSLWASLGKSQNFKMEAVRA